MSNPIKLTKNEVSEITLLSDFILLKEIKEKKKSKIIQLDISDKEKANPVNVWAEVVKVGAEVKNIKIGDFIWIAGMRLASIPVEDEFFFLAKEKDIMIFKKA